VQVWQALLYEDLGFDSEPDAQVLKLGLEKYNPYVSWTDVLKIAKNYLEEGDLSLEAFENALNL